MQITLSVNNREAIKGAVRTKGVLSAGIRIVVPPDKEPRGKAFIHAFDYSAGSSDWAAGSLSVGDKIEIQILPGDDADPPTTTREIFDAPEVLFSDPIRAREALSSIHVCNEYLQGILGDARLGEPHHEALKIQRAIARVVQDLGTYLIRPMLTRYPELTDEAKELGLTD